MTQITPILSVSALALALLCQSATAQLAIPTHTIDAGGGKSSGGTLELTGTIGQPDASPAVSGGALSITGGFWGANTNPYAGAYEAWAALNITPGHDASFGGDADLDGIPNGLVYVFGPTGAELAGKGILTAPPANIPGDVILTLEASEDLVTWTPVLEYTAGAQTLIDAALSIAGGEVTDSASGIRHFYQYTITLIE